MEKIKNRWQQLPLTVKVSAAYVLCSVLQRCMLFLTMPLFTRLMSKEQYGLVTVYSSWQGILQIFLTLNLAYGSFSTAMVRFEKDRSGYISSVEGICILLSGLFLLVYLPLSGFLNPLLELPTPIVCLMVGEILALTSIQLWSGKKRFEFKYVSVVVITLLIAVITPVLQYILVIHHEEKGYARIVGMAAVNILAGSILLIHNLIRGKKVFCREYWSYALRFNIPLLAYYLSQVIFNQSDRIMISHLVGIGEAAVYGVTYGLATVLIFVLDAINNSYIPWLYVKIKTGSESENRMVSLGIAGLMILLLSGVNLFAPEIIWIMAGEPYLEAVWIVPPVSVSLLLLFYSQLFINVEFYYEEKKSLVVSSIAAAVMNILLNWIFIPVFGYIAAAYTTLFSYLLFAVCNCVAMKKVLKKRGLKDQGIHYKGLLLLLAACCVLTAGGAALYGSLPIRIIILLLAMPVLFLQRRKIIGLISRIRQKS